jgi:hypothetical protein
MKRNWLLPLVLILLIASAVISGCCKEDDDEPALPAGKVVLNFHHHVDGVPVSFDSTGYVNDAGNIYEVNEIQYFVSDVTFHKADGSKFVIGKEIDIYYIDSDIPATQRWQVFDAIPEGDYSGISFTFGINEEKNNSFMFVNPPEVNMVWPEFLGGGYHYLKLNGKWQDTLYLRPFNFHMGIGQIYDPPTTYHPDSITGFVHNHFEAVLPNSGFTIAEDQTLEIDIIMQIEEWFKNPVTWDHNVFGNYTMQNQAAMHAMKQNGATVFKVGDIK